jgi:hypothetical protein
MSIEDAIEIVLNADDSLSVDGCPCDASSLLAVMRKAAKQRPASRVKVRNERSTFFDVGKTVFTVLEAGFPEDAVSIAHEN